MTSVADRGIQVPRARSCPGRTALTSTGSGGRMTRFTRNRFSQAVRHSTKMVGTMAALVAAGLFVASCDVHKISGAGSLMTLSISPNPQTVVVNGTQQFTATGVDESGAIVAI